MAKVRQQAGASTWQVVKNATTAASRATAAAVTGKKVLRTDAEQEKIMTICRACPTDKFNGLKCIGCGCFGKLKSRIATESCPDGHW